MLHKDTCSLPIWAQNYSPPLKLRKNIVKVTIFSIQKDAYIISTKIKLTPNLLLLILTIKYRIKVLPL